MNQTFMTVTTGQVVPKGSSNSSRSSVFKYYIHDTAKGFSLELLGSFGESSVRELACCWQTAKSTLKGRALTLDLRGLTSLDEPARQWLASMVQDGANVVPGSFLLDTVAGLPGSFVPAPQVGRQSLLGKLMFWSAPKPVR